MQIESDLVFTRLKIISLVANSSKHNFSRFAHHIETVRDAFARSGHHINTEQVVMTFDDLIDGFLTPVLHYHISTIAEFLIDLQWDIYDYLKPVYRSSLRDLGTEDGHRKYRYEIPNGIVSDLAKGFFWDLMNGCINGPFIERIRVADFHKQAF